MEEQSYALLNCDRDGSRSSLESSQGDSNDVEEGTRHSNFEKPTRLSENSVASNYWMITWSFVCSCFLALLPSFLRSRPPDQKPKRLHHTAYLDGVRGVAAAVVVCHHTLVDRWGSYEQGYLLEDPDRYFLQLPFLRIVSSGRGMVTTFFVLSGFVLSYKPLQFAREGNSQMLLEALASSVFRRPFRLFLATAPSMFITMLMLRFGLAHWLDWARQDTFLQQLLDLWNNFIIMSNPFRGINICNSRWGPAYNGPLWTMPIEFRGSMVVFVMVLGLSRVRPTARMCTVLGTAMFALSNLDWDVFLFIVGILYAELDIIRKRQQSEKASEISISSVDLSVTVKHSSSAFRGTCLKVVQLALFAACIHMLLTPPNWGGAFGYQTMIKLTPMHIKDSPCPDFFEYFWLSIGAAGIVLLLMYSPMLQRPFTSILAQYLGRISFSLYMCHAFSVFTVNWWVRDKLWETWGLFGQGHWITYIVAWAVALWAADIYCRVFDENAVLIGKWAYKKVAVRENP